MGNEVMVFKEGVEHRCSNQVLREHRDGIISRNTIVQVIAQALNKLIKFLAQVLIGIFYQCGNAGDLVFCNSGNVIGPVLPIGAGSDLIHQLGVDGLLPLLQREQGNLLGHCRRILKSLSGLGAFCILQFFFIAFLLVPRDMVDING